MMLILFFLVDEGGSTKLSRTLTNGRGNLDRQESGGSVGSRSRRRPSNEGVVTRSWRKRRSEERVSGVETTDDQTLQLCLQVFPLCPKKRKKESKNRRKGKKDKMGSWLLYLEGGRDLRVVCGCMGDHQCDRAFVYGLSTWFRIVAAHGQIKRGGQISTGDKSINIKRREREREEKREERKRSRSRRRNMAKRQLGKETRTPVPVRIGFPCWNRKSGRMKSQGLQDRRPLGTKGGVWEGEIRPAKKEDRESNAVHGKPSGKAG